MSEEAVASGQVAAVVTWLEMVERPEPADIPSPLRLIRIEQPRLDHYRALFRLVGAPWLWFSRLAMGDEALAAIVHDPAVHLFTIVDEAEAEVGMIELDFRQSGQCELSFVGLVPELSGKGHGRWLLGEALRHAWAGDGVERVHVHTCTLDHPAALGAYRRAGFIAFKRSVERFADPRLTGILPLDCAPQVPLIGTGAALAAARSA
ncbi:MAG: GNAT family N-acetyltransferase [Sphingomicrobium sp.]